MKHSHSFYDGKPVITDSGIYDKPGGKKIFNEKFTWQTSYKNSALKNRSEERTGAEDFHFNRKKSLKNFSQIQLGNQPTNITISQERHFGDYNPQNQIQKYNDGPKGVQRSPYRPNERELQKESFISRKSWFGKGGDTFVQTFTGDQTKKLHDLKEHRREYDRRQSNSRSRPLSESNSQFQTQFRSRLTLDYESKSSRGVAQEQKTNILTHQSTLRSPRNVGHQNFHKEQQKTTHFTSIPLGSPEKEDYVNRGKQNYHQLKENLKKLDFSKSPQKPRAPTAFESPPKEYLFTDNDHRKSIYLLKAKDRQAYQQNMKNKWEFQQTPKNQEIDNLMSSRGTGLSTRLCDPKIEPRVVDSDRALKSMDLRYYPAPPPKQKKRVPDRSPINCTVKTERQTQIQGKSQMSISAFKEWSSNARNTRTMDHFNKSQTQRFFERKKSPVKFW